MQMGVANFGNSMYDSGQNLIFLNGDRILRARVFAWNEYLDLQKNSKKDWINLMKIAIEIYNGEIKGFANLPDLKEMRENLLNVYMRELIQDQVKSETAINLKNYSANAVHIKLEEVL